MAVVRKATASDFNRWQQVKEDEEQSFKLARTKARELGLSMKTWTPTTPSTAPA